MADEYFYGATLTGANKIATWDPQEKDEEEDVSERANKLIVKQILLGHDAKADEYNVVEVETKSKVGSIKIPIAVLKVGENRFAQSFLEFPDAPVTFRLIQGSGPVYIHGHHLLGEYDAMDDMDEEAFDEEDDSENEIRAGDDDDDEPKLKKMKVAGNNTKAVKVEKNSKKK